MSETTLPNYPRWVKAAVLIVAVVLSYLPAMQAGFIWDDDKYVAENKLLDRPGGLRQIWLEPLSTPQYYPMVFTSFWVESRIWGKNPAGFHVVNILLHALAAVLFWALLEGAGAPGAWTAALLFGIHPVHVESVAWITERKNVLSGVFYLGAALAYLRFSGIPSAPGNEEGGNPRRVWPWYAVSLALFLIALLSKTVVATLPAALVIFLWMHRGRIPLREVAWLGPMFLLGLAGGLFTAWVEYNHVGAQGLEWDLSPGQRFVIAGKAVWFYLGKIIWPSNLTFIYPRWTIDSGNFLSYFPALLAAAALAALLLSRRRLGRGPAAAALYFGLTLFPALGFLNFFPMRFSFVADHFQYLASLGPIALLGALSAKLVEVGTARLRWVVRAAVLGLLVLLAGLTWRQTTVYGDAETLWRDTIAKNPAAWMAHVNLGTLLQGRGELSAALTHAREAVRLKPDYEIAQYNVASVLLALGRHEEAIGAFRSLLKLYPNYTAAHNNLAAALFNLGRYREALEHFSAAITLRPDQAFAYFNRGLTYERLGKVDLAASDYRRALDLDPALAAARECLQRLQAGARFAPDIRK
jgi:tetratricopeptide (TPR) repeat protein